MFAAADNVTVPLPAPAAVLTVNHDGYADARHTVFDDTDTDTDPPDTDGDHELEDTVNVGATPAA